MILICECFGSQLVENSQLGHAKLISCSMEHHGNKVGSVGRKEKVIFCLKQLLLLALIAQRIASV